MTNSDLLAGVGTALTKADTANSLFTPLTAWYPARSIDSARATIEMRGSYDCRITPAYQTCNDPDSPDDALSLEATPTYRSAEGVYYPSAWRQLSLASYQWVRFGVLAKNVDNSAMGGCQARINVDIKGP